jgi:hypothetical protein
MRRFTRLAGGGLVLALLIWGAASLSARPEGEKVTLRPVKYADLGKVVRGLKGKVVVVEFWAEY